MSSKTRLWVGVGSESLSKVTLVPAMRQVLLVRVFRCSRRFKTLAFVVRMRDLCEVRLVEQRHLDRTT